MNNFRQLSIPRVPLLEIESNMFLGSVHHDFKQCWCAPRDLALLESVAGSIQMDKF